MNVMKISEQNCGHRYRYIKKNYQNKNDWGIWAERLKLELSCCVNVNRRTEDAREVRKKDGTVLILVTGTDQQLNV
jgi:hypothetical protein